MRSNFNEKGEFRFGKYSYEKARETAENCAKFKLDNDEEEMACGGEISCYDCAFRRWSAESFTCAILFSAIKNDEILKFKAGRGGQI